MNARYITPALNVFLTLLAMASLTWASVHAWGTSADLMRRAEESALFVAREDPYQLPGMTYPPSALVVFAPLVAPFGQQEVRAVWLVLNLVALGGLCVLVVRLWGRAWPTWLKVAFCLAVVAAKPVRGGIALGQFHLIPTALMLAAILALNHSRQVVAGLMVGVSLAKPTMSLPFLGYLVARRQWQALATALGFQAVALLVVSAWLGSSPVRLLREWTATAQSQVAEGAIDLPSLILREWPAAPVSAAQVALVVLALGFAVTMLAGRGSEAALVSFAAFTAAVFTYHRPYDLVLLVPTLAFLIEAARGAGERDRWWRLAAAVGFAALLIAPSHPSVAGRWEAWHDVIFVVFAYLYLGLLVSDLVTKRPSPATASLSGVRGS